MSALIRLNISEASRQYGIKETASQSRITALLKKQPLEEVLNNDSGNESEEDAKYGSKYTAKQVFTIDQEAQLSDYIKKLQTFTMVSHISKLGPWHLNMQTHLLTDNWETHKMAGMLVIIIFISKMFLLSISYIRN